MNACAVLTHRRAVQRRDRERFDIVDEHRQRMLLKVFAKTRFAFCSCAAKIWLAPNATMPTAIAQTATVRTVVMCLSNQRLSKRLRGRVA